MLRRSTIQKRQRKLSRAFERAATSLIQGEITLAEFERTLAFRLKRETVGITKSLTRNKATQAHYGLNGAALRRQYARLDLFAKSIKQGSLTERQIVYRAKQYSKGLLQWFHELEVFDSARTQSHNEAMRRLDPAADHCPECPGHSTNNQWVPIEQIVPVGTACSCGGNCRCSVVTRFNPDLLQQGASLSDKVISAQRDRVKSEPTLDDVLRVLTGRRRSRFR